MNNLFAQPTPEEAEGYNVATTRQMVCFGMEGFPAIVFSGLISTFYMYFATNVAGITIEAAGVILAIASIFDAVTDPIFGTIVDKYKISKKISLYSVVCNGRCIHLHRDDRHFFLGQT